MTRLTIERAVIQILTVFGLTHATGNFSILSPWQGWPISRLDEVKNSLVKLQDVLLSDRFVTRIEQILKLCRSLIKGLGAESRAPKGKITFL